jgi:hypothetical protein
VVAGFAVVIDSRHRRWLQVTGVLALSAVALYLWLSHAAAEPLSGGSRVGLAYGIAGGLLIVFAWLLSGLRYVPSWWWLGSRAFWLKGHVYLGTLSFLLILCHSGGRVGGPLERILYLLFALVVLTGFLGLGLQYVVPRRLTERVPCEVPYEQVPALCARLQAHADELFTKLDGVKLDAKTKEELSPWYAKLVRPFLGWPSTGSLLRDSLRAAEVFAQVRTLPGIATAAGDSAHEKSLAELELLCGERRSLAEQERLQRLLHGWLYLHIPLQAALLVLLLAHVAMTLYY